MGEKPTYEELELKVNELEKEIAEYRQTEVMLLDKYDFFRLIAQYSSVFIYEWNLRTNEVKWFGNIDKVMGYEPGCFARTISAWIDAFHPEDVDRVVKSVNRIIHEKGGTFDEEYRIRHKNGNYRIWHGKGGGIFDKKGKAYKGIGICTDITEKRETEISLWESEEKYRQLVENVEDVIFSTSLEGIITYCSPVVEKYGYDAKKSLGAKIEEYLAGEGDIEKAFRAIEGIKETRRPVTVELTYRTNKGKFVPIEVTVCPFFKKGKSTGFQCIMRDISERKNAEAALKEGEERLRAIFEANPDPMVVYDNQGHPQYLNPAFTQVFGWTLDELKGRPIPFVPDEEKERTFKGIRDLYTNYYGNREPVRDETKRITKSGHTLDILISASIIEDPEEGEPVGIVVNLKDITERKSLEARLQEALRMEAIGTLAGGIAHDFNNLLMAIQGNASLMMIEKDSTHPDFESLKIIEQYVKNGAALTQQLLGFARGGKYDVKPTNINTVIKRTSEMFGRTKKEIQIYKKYQRCIWIVEVDQNQIDQVLLNLYVNAWQAMPGGGELFIETKNLILDESYTKLLNVESGKYVKVSVTDTGVGMDEVTQKKIFEPFFTTKEIGRGTGMGLASVYGIIKNHGGFINAYSEKGVGTTFNFYLPALEKEETIEEKAEEKAILRGFETVLIVDDEDMILDVSKKLLKKLGYCVLVSKSRKEAIEIYEEKKNDIDLIILDLIMPGMDVGETYDRLRDINPDVKVLLSSGYSINEQAVKILNRGCSDFIQKPFNITELLRKIEDLSNQSKV
ncbi:MAG: PAS domain S-box protein [Thermodesulfobacteriota bacterium]|nr:PAS domain S-box protein [Thermodesulfobacteriota bacterium]